MRRINLGVLTAILIALFAGIASIQAQSINQDLITFRNGDLWKFNITNNTATQLTQWGYNGGPVLSPDGSKIAYLSTPSELIDKVNNGTPPSFAGSAPANIWIMDVATEAFTRVADQTGSGELGYLRSVPAWSPDSRKLIWSQLDPNIQALDKATLQIYDLNTGLQATLAQDFNMGFQDGGIWMPDVLWGDGGIARILFTYTESSRTPFLFMEIYNPNTGNLTRYDLGYQESLGNYVRDHIWVNHQGRSMLALYSQDRWELFDPTNGARSQLAAPPRLKAKFIEGGLELIPVPVTSDSGSSAFQWQAMIGQTEYNTGLTTFDIDLRSTPAISFDGSQIAWHNGDGVSTWSANIGQTGRITEERQELGQYYLVPAYQNVAWAPTEWVTSNTTVTVQPTPTQVVTTNTCNLTPRLSVGKNAVVNPGPANRVRVGATTNSSIIGNIDAGEVIYVERGPVCANGFYWYFVRNNRISGWTAEGGNGAYWLSVDVNSAYCFNSPPARLIASTLGVVLPGEPNNIRSNVGTNSTQVLGVMPAGANFSVTGTPVCDDQGLRWYPIQYGSTTGWTAEGQGGEYWIAPAS